MSSYRANSNHSDRMKAVIAVATVHVAIAAVILTGLNVDTVRRAVESMTTIAVAQPKPPPPPPPLPEDSKKTEAAAGDPGKKAEPAPVVAPPSSIPLPSPIPAAPIAGQGSATTAGAGISGTGPGAGGSGTGRGGGGTAGFTPVTLVRNLDRSDYRPLTAGRLPRGSAIVSLTVDTRGLPGNCRVIRSSGDGTVDSGLCPLVIRRLRFRPARDATGKPIEFMLQYVANWSV